MPRTPSAHTDMLTSTHSAPTLTHVCAPAHSPIHSCSFVHTCSHRSTYMFLPSVLSPLTHTHTHTGEHGFEDTSASGVRGRRPRSWRKHPLGVSAAHKRLLCYRKRGVACRELDPHAGRGVLARGSFLVGQWECGADGCFQCF